MAAELTSSWAVCFGSANVTEDLGCMPNTVYTKALADANTCLQCNGTFAENLHSHFEQKGSKEEDWPQQVLYHVMEECTCESI